MFDTVDNDRWGIELSLVSEISGQLFYSFLKSGVI